MKKIFKKILSLTLALITVLGICSLAFAQDDEDVDMLLYPIEDIEISILYAPITSRIVYDLADPNPCGMILKVTYYDGKTEIVMVRKYKEWYVAGDYDIFVRGLYNHETGKPENYGIKEAYIFVGKHGYNMTYEGTANFNVLSIPDITEFSICMEKALSKYF